MEGPEFCSLVQRSLYSLTHGRVQGDPVLQVPGEHTGFGMHRANCSQEEKNKPKQANKTTPQGLPWWPSG